MYLKINKDIPVLGKNCVQLDLQCLMKTETVTL